MATDLERLIVSLEANVKKFESEMRRARTTGDKELRGIEVRASRAAASINQSFGALGIRLRTSIGAALAGITAGQLASFADRFTRAENALKTAGVQGDALGRTMAQIADIAQRTGTPVEDLAKLYGRAAAAQKELKVSSEELVSFTNSVALALKIQGTTAAEAAGGLQQLGQLLGSGKVQAEEFNSVMDSMRPLLQAAADGLEEAGGSVSKLKQLVNDGQVSSQAFFRAVQAGTPILEGQASQAADTFAAQMTRVENALVLAIGAMNKIGGASETVRAAIQFLVDDIAKIPSGLQSTLDEIERILVLIDRAGEFLGFKRNPYTTGGSFGAEGQFTTGGSFGGEATGAGPQINRVSLKDFPVPGKAEGGAGGTSAAQSYIQTLERQRAALEAEQAALGKSNAEKAVAIALAEHAKGATDAERAAIVANVTAIEAAREAVKAYEDAQRRAAEAAQYLGDQATDALADIIIDGKSARDVMADLARTLARAALQSALTGGGPLAAILGTAGSGGLLGIPGRAAGGPVSAGRPYVVGETGRELFVPSSPGRIMPASAMRGAASRPSITVNQTIAANGDAMVARIAKAQTWQALGEYDKQVGSRAADRQARRQV